MNDPLYKGIEKPRDVAQDARDDELEARLDRIERRQTERLTVQTDEQKEGEIERRTQERVSRLLGQLDSRLLTESEVVTMREMIERDKRVQWLWSSARTFAIWIAAVVAGVTVGYDALRTMLKRLVA